MKSGFFDSKLSTFDFFVAKGECLITFFVYQSKTKSEHLLDLLNFDDKLNSVENNTTKKFSSVDKER